MALMERMCLQSPHTITVFCCPVDSGGWCRAAYQTVTKLAVTKDVDRRRIGFCPRHCTLLGQCQCQLLRSEDKGVLECVVSHLPKVI